MPWFKRKWVHQHHNHTTKTHRGWLVCCMQLNQARQMQASQDWFTGSPPQPGCAHAKDASRPGSGGTSKSAVSWEPGSGGASVSAWESVQTQKITFALDMQVTKQHLNSTCIPAYANQSSGCGTWRAWPQQACTQHASQVVPIHKPISPLMHGGSSRST